MYFCIYMNHHISFILDHRVHDWRKIFYPPINNFVLSLSGIGHQLSDRSVQERFYVFSRNTKYTSYVEKGVSFKSFLCFLKWDYEYLEQYQTKKTNICFARPWEKPYQMSRRNKSITVKTDWCITHTCSRLPMLIYATCSEIQLAFRDYAVVRQYTCISCGLFISKVKSYKI